MSYIDENLISGESVTYRAQLHWIVFVKPALVDLVAVVLALASFYVGYPWVAAAFVLLSAIPLAVASIGKSSAEFAVTNKRVILKTGFIQKKTAEMFLNKIESVGVDQSMIGRLFGYGTITIRGTGGTLEPFDRISSPLEFRRQIQEQIGQSFDRPASRAARQT